MTDEEISQLKRKAARKALERAVEDYRAKQARWSSRNPEWQEMADWLSERAKELYA